MKQIYTSRDYYTNRKSLANFIITIMVVIVVIILLGKMYTYFKNKNLELPSSGVYYCEDLDAKLEFRDNEYYLWINNDTCIEFRSGYDNAFHAKSHEKVDSFYAKYQWKAESDSLILEIFNFSSSFEIGKKYYFYRVK